MSDGVEIHKSNSRLTPVMGARLTALPHDAPLKERVEALEEEAAKLALLLSMTQSLSSEQELDTVMGQIVSHTTQIMSCERSSVFLFDKEKNELYALVAQGLDVKELRFSARWASPDLSRAKA